MKSIDVAAAIRAAIREHGSQAKAAQALGISASYIGEVLRGNKPASNRLLDALGLSREVVIRRKAS